MTTEQAREYQAHLTATTKSLTERTLMTREMREQLERDKASKRNFERCDVRVRFPDGMQLQGTFAAHERVRDIYDFVREQLNSPVEAFQLRMVSREMD
jgi:UBX domain-containing protein 6